MDFLGRCLVLDPSQRPPAAALLQEAPYLARDGFSRTFPEEIRAKIKVRLATLLRTLLNNWLFCIARQPGASASANQVSGQVWL